MFFLSFTILEQTTKIFPTITGLQKYMNQLFPLTDWSLESMKQALTVIIRRIDKLFSKMHKTVKVSTFHFI